MKKQKKIILFVTLISVILFSSATLSCEQILNALPEEAQALLKKGLFDAYTQLTEDINEDADTEYRYTKDKLKKPDGEIDETKLAKKGHATIAQFNQSEAFAFFIKSVIETAADTHKPTTTEAKESKSAKIKDLKSKDDKKALELYKETYTTETGKPAPTKVPYKLKKYASTAKLDEYTVVITKFKKDSNTITGELEIKEGDNIILKPHTYTFSLKTESDGYELNIEANKPTEQTLPEKHHGFALTYSNKKSASERNIRLYSHFLLEDAEGTKSAWTAKGEELRVVIVAKIANKKQTQVAIESTYKKLAYSFTNNGFSSKTQNEDKINVYMEEDSAAAFDYEAKTYKDDGTEDIAKRETYRIAVDKEGKKGRAKKITKDEEKKNTNDEYFKDIETEATKGLGEFYGDKNDSIQKKVEKFAKDTKDKDKKWGQK